MSDGFYTRQGRFSSLNITAATVVKAAAPAQPSGLQLDGGRIVRVSVIVAGSAVGAVYDSSSTTVGNTAANQLFVIPNTVGVYMVDMPCAAGICVIPGSGQTVAVSYD